MSERADHPGDREAGFTLLELLVALTLLGLLMVLVFGGLRLGTRVWERSDAQGAGTDEVRLAQSLIRRELETAYPYLVVTDPLHPHVDFEGGPEGMSFLGAAPQAIAEGGRARIDLRQDQSETGTRLTINMRPELAGPARVGLENEVLLKGVRSLHFSYYGSSTPGEAASWHDRWSGALHLPELVRIDITFRNGDPRAWPEMIIAPRIAVDVGCLYDPLTKRCQGR